jgi:mannose-1-phosphate guanylyltransferase/mannose-6-phosphate isomerase
VLAAALAVARDDPEAIILVAPSDHVIPDTDAFQKAVTAGCEAAETGKLVTFGINPTRPETGYGYLELTETRIGGEANALPLERFVEKPNAERAAEMLTTGKHLWNAGIFLFKAGAIIDAFNAHAPAMVKPVTQALDDAEADLGFLRLDADAWAQVPEDSIDFAVMEKAKDLAVVPYDGIWSDLGGWDAVWRDLGPDDQGNVLGDHATAIDCKGSLLRTEAETLELVGIGLDNIIAVAMNDAVLVADKSRAQDVKKAVNALKAKDAKQATAFPIDHRPWGWFETLVLSDRFQVKRIVVKPGEKLSLQSHVHRSEHWIVVSGTAKVTVDDDVNLLTENESVYIPLGAVHRMENPGKVPMVLIEVQTGVYLGEDDIIRYEDVYART